MTNFPVEGETLSEVGGQNERPLVSVIMPSYRQESFIMRAVLSLAEQSYEHWELVLVDDGSPCIDIGAIRRAVAPHLVSYLQHDSNQGLGVCLNAGTALANGKYIAYLPSDDIWRVDHLSSCVDRLSAHDQPYLVYSKVRWHPDASVSGRAPITSATLRSDICPGQERALLDRPDVSTDRLDYSIPSGNLLALVQVMHRRSFESQVIWQERKEVVSDRLEFAMWSQLLRLTARFVCTQVPSAEWSDHPDQRHKIISGRGRNHKDWRQHAYGLPVYKQFYGVPDGFALNWRPTQGGVPVDEREQIDWSAAVSEGWSSSASRAVGRGLRVLVAGGLGFNGDRARALIGADVELRALWMPQPHFWDAAAPLPFHGIPSIAEDNVEDEVREFAPDVIYGLLNWSAIPFLLDVRRRFRDIPFVFHFKESPFLAMRAGYWSDLIALVEASDQIVLSSNEMLEWFRSVTLSSAFDRALVMDGDLPSRIYGQEQRTTNKLSALDGQIHTVSVGRTFVEDKDLLAELGIHLHVYGQPSTQFGRSSVADLDSEFVHFHGAVESREWREELSRYDAGWMHIFDSSNDGDLRFADWNDLNTPARLGTYAAAGLPLILRANKGSRTAVNSIAERHGCGITFSSLQELRWKLEDEVRTQRVATAMEVCRHVFMFESHLDMLLNAFESVVFSRADIAGLD